MAAQIILRVEDSESGLKPCNHCVMRYMYYPVNRIHKIIGVLGNTVFILISAHAPTHTPAISEKHVHKRTLHKQYIVILHQNF